MGIVSEQTWLCCASVVWSIAFGCTAFCQVAQFRLSGSLEGVAARTGRGGEALKADLGPGARLLESAEGGGVEPGHEGPAVKISLPDALWRPTGTLAFRLKSSRTVRMSERPSPAAPIVDSPILRAELGEQKGHTVLAVKARAGDGSEPTGRLDLSHLKGGRWYHLALAWDARRGRLEAYLNGTLQEQMRLRGASKPWEPVTRPSGPLLLGGTVGGSAKITVDSVELFSEFMDEAAIQGLLKDRKMAPLQGEGRTVYTGALDLSEYTINPVYEADFAKALNVVPESELFEGDRRVRQPDGKDWVLEGAGRAWTQEGRMRLESARPEKDGHLVLWNTRVFPSDFVLEFGMSPKNPDCGLNIIFFCSRSRAGNSIFEPGLPRRDGVFAEYHSGALNCYHISYWACSSDDGGVPRRTTNLRKNHGFYLPSCGDDGIAGAGAGPHLVRLLKFGGKIMLETRGQLSLVFEDDGKAYGPVWGEGMIGLRQMAHTHWAGYTHFKVWEVTKK